MKKSKKSISIPDWFDLKKYESGKKLPLLDWALNLTVRLEIKRSMHLDVESVWPKQDIDLIKKHGFLTRENTKNVYDLAKSDFNLMELKPGMGLVYPLPLYRAFEIYREVLCDTELRHKIAMVDYQEIFYDQRSKPLHSGEVKLKKWFEEFFLIENYDESCCGNYAEFSPHICVDLGAPDETLIDAFKDWLKFKRNDEDNEGSDLPEKVSTKLIQRWESSAILPYLDLIMHQQLEKIAFPAHVIGNAIFPDTVDFDTTEAIRKTTRSNAGRAQKPTATPWRG